MKRKAPICWIHVNLSFGPCILFILLFEIVSIRYSFNDFDICHFQHIVKPGSYTWIHHRPPPQHRPNNFDMYDVLDMLSEVDLSSGEFYSIMRDSEFFDGMDPFEMMAISDSLASGSGPCLNPFDSDEEEGDLDFFQMAALSEALASGVDDFGPEDFDNEELNPMEAALLSMMMHSNMEDEEEESDEDY